MHAIRQPHKRGEIVPDEVQSKMLEEQIRSPTLDTLDNVVFLIEQTVCPVDNPMLLVWAVQQKTFPGQLQVVRALICAGAPIEAARRAANSRFENLWNLITNTLS